MNSVTKAIRQRVRATKPVQWIVLYEDLKLRKERRELWLWKQSKYIVAWSYGPSMLRP